MDEFAKSATGYTKLEASSIAVGLPEGLMGNSEVGHLNIGAGRVVWQDVVRIDLAIKKGEFASTEEIKKSMEAAKNGNGRLHLCGLVSHGGVVCILAPGRSQNNALTVSPTARQAGAPLFSAQGCQAVRGPRGIHPLLRRWP